MPIIRDNITKNAVPEPTLRRLPWYLAYVTLLHHQGVQYVSSTAISREINVDSSQIAKDLSALQIRGKTRIGYDTAELEESLRNFLGFNRQHNAVMIGVGSLGSALIADRGLDRFGLNIVAGFDVNDKIIGTTLKNVAIFPIDRFAEISRAYNAEVAIIAVPVDHAQASADMAVGTGIRALWNFTPFRIRTSGNTVIQNTSIYADLAVMYHRINCAD